VLQNGGGDNLAISGNGPFTFATKLAAGAGYAVTVLTQPGSPTQTCAVTNASGTVGMSDVTNVSVTCTTKTYAVGGTVTGLSGSGLVLRDNGGDDLPVSGNGAFSFATAIANGAAYSVSISVQPTNPVQNCTLTNGTAQGTVGAAAVTTVAVVCANVGRFLYTANIGDHSISAFSIDATTGALTAIAGSPYAGALKASYVAVEPTGRFLYALDNENGSQGIAAAGIDVYSIGAGGALSVVAGSPFPTDAGAFSMTILPGGKFAYTANVNSMSVSAYTLDPMTGVVGPVTGSPFPGGANPIAIATDPSGSFVYTANNGGGDVSAYVIEAATGAVSTVTGSPFKAASGPNSISVVPSGKFMYVADNGSTDVSAFTIDANTGALAPLAGTPYAAGINPTSVATDPSGTFLYVASGNAAGTPGAYYVSGFVIDANTGALTPIPGSSLVSNNLATAVTIDPSGKFLFVASDDAANNILAFAINPSTGALTPVPGSPFAAGPIPQSIAVSK
jgi:6-phosphogluconolactonase (cycloisomerase 2 family)